MKFLYLSVFFILSIFSAEASTKNFIDYVNPLMGTASSFELSTGNTYPAIARPWGMNFWTAQTGRMGDGWQYVYGSNKIRGFKQTHQPSPWVNDYGQFVIMPVVGKMAFNEDERSSWFSHKAEIASPHYYQVYLSEHDVLAELTATERAASFRFTFPESDESYIVVDALDMGSYIKILEDEQMIIGYSSKNAGFAPSNFKNYFVITFDKPFRLGKTFSDGKLNDEITEVYSEHVGGIVGFSTKRGEKIHVNVASSFISIEQAKLNLREVLGQSFDDTVEQGCMAWNSVLGRIDVESDSETKLKTFYSCLYRSLLFPRKFYEINASNEIVHYSPHTGEIYGGYMYTDTGFWDTFRCLFPLLNLVYPEVNKEVQEGLINTYKESGFFPEWQSPGHRDCMIGNNSASVLVDAYMKGIRVEDIALLYEGLVHGTENVHKTVLSTGRLGHEFYNKLGYIPCDVGIKENAAHTLEYAYNDWCIWKLAKELGKPKKEIDKFAKRAFNYKNLFDEETKLMRGKCKNGKFVTPFSPFKWGDSFTEGNSWHYTWSVFHDPQGLINLMGGNDVFTAMLDSVFVLPPIFDESYYGHVIHEIREMTIMNMGNYAHGNQPIQHMIYLYNYSGVPWKAQYWVRQVLDKLYTPTPDGYCGDEDNGQTSAWYVFSALGFYPVCPCTDQYVIGSPLFPKVTVKLPEGKILELVTENNAKNTPYIQSVSINGNNYTKNYFTFKDLRNGGRIIYNMDTVPNMKRGIDISDYPYSFTLDTERNG